MAIISFVACRCSSSGRAPPCQGGGSEFEPRHLLQNKRTAKRLSFCFGFRRPAGGSTLRNFTCSGQVNCPCAKVLPCGQNACAAHDAPPARRAGERSGRGYGSGRVLFLCWVFPFDRRNPSPHVILRPEAEGSAAPVPRAAVVGEDGGRRILRCAQDDGGRNRKPSPVSS